MKKKNYWYYPCLSCCRFFKRDTDKAKTLPMKVTRCGYCIRNGKYPPKVIMSVNSGRLDRESLDRISKFMDDHNDGIRTPIVNDKSKIVQERGDRAA